MSSSWADATIRSSKCDGSAFENVLFPCVLLCYCKPRENNFLNSYPCLKKVMDADTHCKHKNIVNMHCVVDIRWCANKRCGGPVTTITVAV